MAYNSTYRIRSTPDKLHADLYVIVYATMDDLTNNIPQHNGSFKLLSPVVDSPTKTEWNIETKWDQATNCQHTVEDFSGEKIFFAVMGTFQEELGYNGPWDPKRDMD